MIGSDKFEKIFYLYTRENPKYLKNIKENFYENKAIALIHNLTNSFYSRFSQMPSVAQIKTVAKQEPFKNVLTDGIVDIIFEETLDTYDPTWLQETSQAWIMWKSLDQSLIDTLEYVKTVKVTPDNVSNIVNRVKDLINERNSIIFDQDLGKDFFDSSNHIAPPDSKISSGYNWIDDKIGGYSYKSLIVWGGAPNKGKSIFLANDAANFVRMGHNVAVISAEMSDFDFIKRIGANLLDIKIDDYDKLAKQGDYIKKRLDSMSNGVIPCGRLFVKEVPTSATSVPDLEAYLIQLEKLKGVKLKVIVIDYINILANYRNPNTENTYMKIKQIAEDLRAMAVRNEWIVISATQLGKQGWDITDPTMADIAESAGLSHTADIMYVLMQDDAQMLANEYMVKIIKVRNGKGKHWKCKYDIDYSHMKLTETDQIFEPKN